MTRSTHAIAGLVAGLVLRPDELRGPALGLALLAGLGALMPDWDIRLGLKHRGVTHSLIALALVFGVFWLAMPGLGAVALAVGYASHLLLDACTVSGVPLLFPAAVRFKLARFVTGSLWDRLIGGALVLLFAALLIRWPG